NVEDVQELIKEKMMHVTRAMMAGDKSGKVRAGKAFDKVMIKGLFARHQGGANVVNSPWCP
ncbi:unnamed protein product, partial [marine sediment metagenome]